MDETLTTHDFNIFLNQLFFSFDFLSVCRLYVNLVSDFQKLVRSAD